jgi:hypothetical protein
MKLDREEHRAFLIALLDAVPVTGARAQIAEFLNMAAEVEAALQNAEVENNDV